MKALKGKKEAEFKMFSELDFVEVGKCYRDDNMYYRLDAVGEDGEYYGVHFDCWEYSIDLWVGVCLEWAVDENTLEEITEEEFYKALDLVREDFMKKFKAVKGGVL